MVKWAIVSTNKINRIGYKKEKESLFIDFVGSETDTVYLKVPEALYTTFIEAKFPDQFYSQFVEGYFEVAVVGHFNFAQYPSIASLDKYRQRKVVNK